MEDQQAQAVSPPSPAKPPLTPAQIASSVSAKACFCLAGMCCSSSMPLRTRATAKSCKTRWPTWIPKLHDWSKPAAHRASCRI